MPSPVYRGGPTDDPKGFQPQAVGNYPAKSDVADTDNIYLSDRGWVYRHYKSLDKSKFWDEVIWAGDVTNPPTANDPVDPFGDADPDFLNGDGIQFVAGVYPGVDPTIGTTTINAASDGDTGTAIPFKIITSGTLASGNTYAWSVDGPGTATFSAGTQTGTFSGDTDSEANVSITFPTDGQYTVTCTLKTSATASTGSVGQAGFAATTNVPADTIGTVTVNGQTTPEAGVGLTYSASYTGTAPQGDITYAWTATPNSGVTLTQPGDNPEDVKVIFTTQASVTSTVIKCVLTDASASDSGAFDELTVVPHFVIGSPTATIGGTASISMVKSTTTAAAALTYTSQSNPAPNDLTYAWTCNPSSAGTFNDATIAGPTFTAANAAGGAQLTCLVGSAKSDPTTSTSSVIFVTITDS